MALIVSPPGATAQPLQTRAGIAVRQQTAFSCGAAALVAVLTRLGVHTDEQALAARMATTDSANAAGVSRGYNLAELKRLAESFGMQARGLRLGLRALVSMPPPVLVRLHTADGPHFSTLVATGNGPAPDISLADPSWGDITLDFASFAALWLERGRSGVALEVRPPEGH